ncbi:TPA: NUDIX hydrolase [candidate division WWE3 bacterium]|uniref:NUDIX hydrolase n=1 Tax=candidate division WWE3 bacterium TaxID=2053526 RepID=A0A656PNE5_UNCKA|nr:hypothetical protein P147_WWE3C00001G0227 [candidate division WWE3 bacterium RAAC2_WWE3_1]KKS29903.1 MAG: hypothetical protein UU91_C0003G0061 [candidate division WWE3 bacterium GW2011_GWB1_42_117]KKS55328.1 MAG: hypothetical protein UV21_C0002G0202 [candidate division WWE3 bacterium GW2011_GWD2_42_34]KKT05881.1 MAG: hypothetical protein UV83_C0001G0199 [candidate division WWE3 bacterium GW2011_GWE2_43_18]KKT07229.1 MAG: hypothetical protein UV84_C0001G0065 [candidate division WWE3 bacterium
MNEDTFHLGIKALIKNKEGKVLLLRVNLEQLKNHSLGAYWDIPGGRIHKNSSVEETLKREIEEETGITSITSFSKLDMVLSNIRIPEGETSLGLILGIYICEVNDTTNIKISEEHTDAKWFDPKEAADLLKVKYPADFCSKIATL